MLTNRPEPGLRRFYLRRAARILPGYWLAVVVTLGVLTPRPSSLGDWLSYLRWSRPTTDTT